MRKLIVLMTALLMAALLQGCGTGSAGMDAGSGAKDDAVSTTDSSAAPTITFTGFAVVQVDGALSGKVVAFFDEDMDSSTINTRNFVVRGPDGTAIPGSVLYIGVTGVFTPTVRFTSETHYTATIGTGVRSLSGVPMANPKVFAFTTPSPSELTGVLVRVASTAPAAYAIDVPLNSGVNVTFRQIMEPSSINGSTITVYDQAGAQVPGHVHYSGLTASFVPATSLKPDTTYRLIVGTGAKALTGVSMDQPYRSLFTTSSSGATVPPQVMATAPMLGDADVSLTGVVVADFNEGMDTTSINTRSFTLRDAGGNPVDGTVSYTGDIAVFTPDAPLQPEASYTATISTAAQSSGGMALSDAYSWNFTTGSAVAAQAPAVLFTSPAPWDTGSAVTNAISVAFDQPLDPASLGTGTVQVMAQDGSLVSGTLTCSGNMLFFMPDEYLHFNTQYSVTLSPGIRSLSGGYLGQAYSWSFTTLQPELL